MGIARVAARGCGDRTGGRAVAWGTHGRQGGDAGIARAAGQWRGARTGGRVGTRGSHGRRGGAGMRDAPSSTPAADLYPANPKFGFTEIDIVIPRDTITR